MLTTALAFPSVLPPSWWHRDESLHLCTLHSCKALSGYKEFLCSMNHVHRNSRLLIDNQTLPQNDWLGSCYIHYCRWWAHYNNSLKYSLQKAPKVSRERERETHLEKCLKVCSDSIEFYSLWLGAADSTAGPPYLTIKQTGTQCWKCVAPNHPN